MRWIYRLRQFLEALTAAPTPADLALVRTTLTPTQAALFAQLQPSEQAHAARVLREVQARCHAQGFPAPADLQTAALLHDVGKARYPLRLWERVIIVLGQTLRPEMATRWGKDTTSPPRGLRRPFVIAAQHPAWGADMAAARGASPRVAALIRRHQDPLPLTDAEEDQWLAILQAVDDEN